jgi:hypothetical protein
MRSVISLRHNDFSVPDPFCGAFCGGEPWFKTQLIDPVPGSGANNTFGAVVPQGVDGGQANVADSDDRWQWVNAANVGIWATFEAWAPANQNINPADVTNLGLDIPSPLPGLGDIATFAAWSPPA